MLLYAAIGDAYGAAFEFVEKERWPVNDGNHFHKHPDLDLGDGRYTDDTQMMLALAEMAQKASFASFRPSKEAFYNAWYTTYRRDPRPGYSKGFAKLLSESNSYVELAETINPTSSRSGAVMRSAILGTLPRSLESIRSICDTQTETTHNTKIAKDSAFAMAAAAYYLFQLEKPRDGIGDYLNEKAKVDGVDWNEPRTEWATIEAIDCAWNAITAWRNSKTLREVLINSVEPGGDTDTVATIAMSLAWADKTITNDLTPDFLNGLENGTYGYSYLELESREITNE